ncbi:MAG: thioesterase [Synechococcales cyanobacterium CRU_2_2]|nr:thioesterase [Synechococcales cyanobacterium CRU_2_2]
MTKPLVCFKPNPDATLRLFCFPFAGGSAQVYYDWPKVLPPSIELHAVELPGRGRRFAEEPLTALGPLVRSLVPHIQRQADKPFIFFGHSLGGLIAFELARRLQQLGGSSPLHLYVSAARAPQIERPHPSIFALPDAQFIEAIRCYDGTPEAILENQELMELLLPSLRADFSVLENYRYQPIPLLTCPLSAFSGKADEITRAEEVQPWEAQTQSQFVHQFVEGGHFFVNQPAFIRIFSQTVQRAYLTRPHSSSSA